MTRRIDQWSGSHRHDFHATHPTRLQEIREKTNNQIPFNWVTKKCECCKRSRSPAQFKEGSKTCKRCPPTENDHVANTIPSPSA